MKPRPPHGRERRRQPPPPGIGRVLAAAALLRLALHAAHTGLGPGRRPTTSNVTLKR
ncbi:MAG TPA: hypothetical protein VHF89_12045 [Solirubrobacteraceae bacterium]|nr:hypothetical protein [Solirubrobacteraceae bacterium]